MKSNSYSLKIILNIVVALIVFIGFRVGEQWVTKKMLIKTTTQRDFKTEMEKELNKFEFYSELVKIYPELRERIITSLAKPGNDKLTKDSKDRIVFELKKIIDEYFYDRVSFATDESVYNLLKRNLEVLEQYKLTYPEFCVKYFIGKPPFTGIIPLSDLKKIVDVDSKYKLDIIKSSIKYPTIMKKITQDEMLDLLQIGYKNSNADIKNIAYIENPDKLPASDACKIGIDFTRAILSLGTVNSSMLFKNLLQAAKKKQ